MIEGADTASLGEATCAVVHDALTGAPGRIVALAVGETTLPLYPGLDPGDPGWEGREISPVDELVPPPTDPSRRLGNRLAAALPTGLRHRLRPLDVSGELGRRAAALDARLQSEGLAIAVLGLGPDGHIAFNQPPSSADAPTRIVDLHPANLARLPGVEPARAALTMGVAMFLAASAVLVVVDGAGKDAALERLLHGPEGPDCPASWLRRHPCLTIALGHGLRRSPG